MALPRKLTTGMIIFREELGGGKMKTTIKSTPPAKYFLSLPGPPSGRIFASVPCVGTREISYNRV